MPFQGRKSENHLVYPCTGHFINIFPWFLGLVSETVVRWFMDVCGFSWCLFLKFKDVKRCFGKILNRFFVLKV